MSKCVSILIQLKSVPLDELEIRKDDSGYVVRLWLTEAPSPLWQRAFEDEWKATTYTLKREVKLYGNAVEIKGYVKDAWDEHIDRIKHCINATNKKVEETEEAQRRQAEEKKEKSEEEIRKIREALSKILS